MRALDRELAELMGLEAEAQTGWIGRPGLWFSELPAFSSTWEGFGLLVEEAERRGWDWQGGEWNWLNTAAKTKHRSRSVIVFTGDRNRCDATGRDIRHAFALAMRDALKEAQG